MHSYPKIALKGTVFDWDTVVFGSATDNVEFRGSKDFLVRCSMFLCQHLDDTHVPEWCQTFMLDRIACNQLDLRYLLLSQIGLEHLKTDRGFEGERTFVRGFTCTLHPLEKRPQMTTDI